MTNPVTFSPPYLTQHHSGTSREDFQHSLRSDSGQDYTATLTEMLLSTNIHENYFCQNQTGSQLHNNEMEGNNTYQNQVWENPSPGHFGLTQSYPRKSESQMICEACQDPQKLVNQNQNANDVSHVIPDGSIGQNLCHYDHTTHAGKQDDESSIRSLNDDDKSCLQPQPGTDEDTKAFSEEDSPLPSTNGQIQGEQDNKRLEIEEEKATQEYQSLIIQTQKQCGKVCKDDFSLIQVIGTGSYGKVLLVKKKSNGNLYAMKVLKKKQLRKQRQVKNTMTERKILEKVQHPFIVRMNCAFQNEKKLFFVLDYCPGGELFFYISQIGRFKEQSAKFYAANILLALECLHENGIIYRDLKPENILIDKDGYAKLTDFGLSKDNFMSGQKANSFCGTAEYLAPEVLNKKGYTMSCDWWSFGCVIYEMLSATPPFYSKKREEIYDKIRFKNPNFYSFHSQSAVDLISKLLTKDPTRRLGSKNDAQEIKEHPFFADINWDAMMAKKLSTPYKPLLDSKVDTKHFDQEICNIPCESPNTLQSGGNQNSGSYMDDINDDFDGFSFIAQTEQSANDTPFNLQEPNYD